MANSTIEEIKDRLNIVDVISSYIPAKKSGTNYKANCPFHKEKSASLMISPSKQIWHCFGCGEGGDVFGFVMKYENQEFGETLKQLAERAGVELPKYAPRDAAADQHKETLLRANNLAAKFYHKVLLESTVAEHARKYLKERGLTEATIKEWQIGFAPDDFHILETFLLKKGFSEKDLLDAGLSGKGERGQIYDRFVNRITFPILNYAGDVVGFTARILDAKAKAAKYVNSPETAVYSKGKVIFGLYKAKQEIRKQDAAIVVEGNMDVIACHQAGFRNVVASSGTAFTFEQLQTLSRLTKNLKFSFDTDQAGLTATRRALDLSLQLGFSVYVVKIEGAKDPDELLKKNPAAFKKALEDAMLYLDFFFEKAFENYNPTSVENKKQIVGQLLPLIQKLSDPLELSHYVRILAQRFNTSEKTIFELLANAKAKGKSGSAQAGKLSTQAHQTQQQGSESAPTPLVANRSYVLEQKILGYVLFKEEYQRKIFEQVNAFEIRNPAVRSIFEKLKSQPAQDIEAFIAALGDDTELAKMALFMVESEYSALGDPKLFNKEFVKSLGEFKTNSAKIQMAQILAEMVLAEQKKDKQKINELNQKFLEASKILSAYN